MNALLLEYILTALLELTQQSKFYRGFPETSGNPPFYAPVNIITSNMVIVHMH